MKKLSRMKSSRISPGGIPSVIQLPSSKSYANRALILAALKKCPVSLKNMSEASDVRFLLEALKKIGLEIRESGPEIEVRNSFPECENLKGHEVIIGEGGTTGRFLASLLLLGSAPYTLILGEGLAKRPWEEFIKMASELGAKVQLKGKKLFVQGPIRIPEELIIDCSRTTQFASGMMLALAFHDVKIVTQNLKSSESYWDMTKQMIHHFHLSSDYKIPLDWSSASYPMALGALKQEVYFPELLPDPYQADSKFFDFLNTYGIAKVEDGGIKIIPKKMVGSLKMDVSDCLDLVPTLAFFLSHIDGRHELKGIENLVFKESDRLTETLALLSQCGVKCESDKHSLWIEGHSTLRMPALDLSLPEDHRMVMCGTLFLRAHSGGSIFPADAVSKSYPGFFGLFTV